MRWLWLAASLSLSLLATGCRDAQEPEPTVPPVTVGAGGGASAASTGGGHPAGGNGGAGGAMDTVSTVRIGLTPNALHQGPGQPTPSETLLAELKSYAAAVRARVLTAHWADLASDAGMAALTLQVAELRARSLDIMLIVDVVDRRLARRPEELSSLPWDSPAAIQAFNKVMKLLIAQVGAELAVVAIGRDADVYAQTHPNKAAALTSFAAAAVSAVVSSGPKPPRAAVGLSYLASPPSSETSSLAALGTALVLSYHPDLGKPSLGNAFAPAKDLDGMLALAGKRPIYLSEVSFTSAAALGASVVTQAQRVADLSAALQPRRDGFPIVNLARLHDLTPEACKSYQDDQSLLPSDPELTYLCASGMHDTAGAAKKAWYAFLAASAAYAQP